MSHGFANLVLRVDVVPRLRILSTSFCLAIHILLKDSNSSVMLTKMTFFYTVRYSKEQVNILVYDFLPNKSNTLNQDIIKFVINFFKKFAPFDKPLFIFKQ